MGCCLRKQHTQAVSGDQKQAFAVKVHVYSLINDQGNFLLTAVAGGGVYHSGTEVAGKEYAYGGFTLQELTPNGEPLPDRMDRSGVWVQQPLVVPPQMSGARYKCGIDMGVARLTELELKHKLVKLSRTWKAIDYDVLQKNCNHFTTQLCEVLQVDAPPAWINDLADKGVSMARVLGNLGSAFNVLSPSPSMRPNSIVSGDRSSLAELDMLSIASPDSERSPRVSTRKLPSSTSARASLAS
mmetsp:Transcript_31322/g.57425  ORF Transcript_31322/g.57425 Transcript_31322/m.57425 type:complete len:241 (+) Transcript_31322:126-848(+)